MKDKPQWLRIFDQIIQIIIFYPENFQKENIESYVLNSSAVYDRVRVSRTLKKGSKDKEDEDSLQRFKGEYD